MVLLQWIFHLDRLLPHLFSLYPNSLAGIIWLILFLETGLVFLPFLPGDSLIFATGTLTHMPGFSLWLLIPLLCSAAILGDAVNYKIGNICGKWIIARRWIRPQYLQKAEYYFETKGSKAIFLARFVPIMRTIVPFLAGVSNMDYPKFLKLNIIGGICWVSIFLISGHLFGRIPWISAHFSTVVLGIIGVSLLPIAWDLISHSKSR